MTDSRQSYDEQLPWLEAVDDEDGPPGVSARKMLAALAVVLLAALVVAGTFYWLGSRNVDSGGAPELIRAEPGPFKVRPDNPGGLDVTGESETAYETSAGEDPDSRLDLEALPEQPPAAPPEPNAAAKAEEPVPAPKKAAEAPQAPSGAPGSVVQLGAYKSAGQAQRGWDALSARFPVLSGLNKMIVPFSGGYRLRAGAASPEGARQICRTLEAGGENCFVAN
jgi:hypothetical protein